ncbi:MAG TPA: DUF5615 family PIN-like protein [Acetobacteraceae bacterium]|jgi:predicted nuclease of predicted toxin-antitoxin system
MTPFRLLPDEMISPAIVVPLWGVGIDALTLRDRGLLAAEDHAVWRLAQRDGRTVVTANGTDFMKLAARASRHAGLLVIPGGASRAEQLAYISNATDCACRRNIHAPGFANAVVTVGEDQAVAWAEAFRRAPGRSRR